MSNETKTGKVFICSRQVECLMEIRAPTLRHALAQLPLSADELVEQADGVAFGTQWEVQIDGVNSTPRLFDDLDVEEAHNEPLFIPGDDL